VTSANRWLPASKKPFLTFARIAAGGLSRASPTGQPLDALHAQYPKTPITATIGTVGGGPPPTLQLTGFTWIGAVGGTAAKPNWTWAISSGVADSITINFYGDAKTTPTTLLDSVTGGGALLSYQYIGTTVANNYYRIYVVATNASGSSNLSDIEFNHLAIAPTVTLTSFAFLGTIGGTYAQPSWVWSYGGDPATSYTWNITQLDTNQANPVTLDSGTSPITNYTYSGATIYSCYYVLNVTATNATGVATLTSQKANVSPLTIAITSQSIGVGISAPISLTITSTDCKIINVQLYQSKSTTDPGISLSGYTLINTYSVNPITGYDSYTRNGATIIGRYYRWRVTAVNNASITATTLFPGPSLLCASS